MGHGYYRRKRFERIRIGVAIDWEGLDENEPWFVFVGASRRVIVKLFSLLKMLFKGLVVNSDYCMVAGVWTEFVSVKVIKPDFSLISVGNWPIMFKQLAEKNYDCEVVVVNYDKMMAGRLR